MPNATSVPMPSTNASSTNHQSASFTVSQKTSGSPTRLSRTPTPMSAPTAISRLRGLHPEEPAQLRGPRCRSPSRPRPAELVEAVVELVAPAERVVGPARERGGLEHRERGRDRLLAHDPHRGRHRALGADDRGGRGQELGDVARGLAEPGAARREVEADEARRRRRRPARACRRACRARRARACSVRSSPHVRRAARRSPRRRRGRRARCPATCSTTSSASAPLRPGDDDARRVDAGVARQQLEVRLVLHLRAPARQERRRRVAVREVAPRARHELGVGFVAPERDDAHRAGRRSVGDEHRAARPVAPAWRARRSPRGRAACSACRHLAARPGRPTGVPNSVLDRVRRRPSRARWRRSGRWGTRATR